MSVAEQERTFEPGADDAPVRYDAELAELVRERDPEPEPPMREVPFSYD